MQTIFTNFRLPAIISFLLILPFMMMEVANRRNFNEGFPIVLFIIMWLLPTLFILTVDSDCAERTNRKQLGGKSDTFFDPTRFFSIHRMDVVGILIDQLPCFLGVPNCD